MLNFIVHPQLRNSIVKIRIANPDKNAEISVYNLTGKRVARITDFTDRSRHTRKQGDKIQMEFGRQLGLQFDNSRCIDQAKWRGPLKTGAR